MAMNAYPAAGSLSNPNNAQIAFDREIGIQKPCFETCVTSGLEVLVPSIVKLLNMRLDHRLRLS